MDVCLINWIIRGSKYTGLVYYIVLIDIVLARRIFFNVSYALWFSSSIALMTWLVILRFNVIILYIKKEPLETMDCLIVSNLLFLLNLVTECHNVSRSVCHVQFVMFNPNLLCLN